MNSILNFFRDLKKYLRISKSSGIARRYFVMNGFDGALTMLGILLGFYFAGSENTTFILSAGVGAAIALGVSGVTSAYMAEDAERQRELRNLESAMLIKLDDTIHERANRFATIYLALVDGISPVLTALIILSPFIFNGFGFLDIAGRYNTSFAITVCMFFLLGSYLGRISGDSRIKKGVQMVLIGILTSVLIFLFSII
ncbi:MAG: hypothetical protein KKD39_01700 [Candidatus Altiarchaeota archaeon]|nr:hypothetical protein [Candidatus Altiarchaeota archaeon]